MVASRAYLGLGDACLDLNSKLQKTVNNYDLTDLYLWSARAEKSG